MHRLSHILLFLLPMISVGQNLVVNGSFEEIDSCNFNYGGIEAAVGWSTFYFQPDYPPTPDLYNECSVLVDFSVPENVLGFQEAASGVSYAGFIPIAVTESIRGILSQPLIEDSLYHVSFNVSLADRFQKAMRDIGLVFLDSSFTIISDDYFTVEPDLVESNWITDKTGWYFIDTVYEAHGGETHFAIAYFPNENIYETLPGQDGDWNSTYYYVDDVSVISYSKWLGIQEPKITFSIYPNPASTNLTIESRAPLAQVWVRDVAGRRLITQTLKQVQGDTQIDVSSLPRGIYLVEVFTQNGQRSVQKVVVK